MLHKIGRFEGVITGFLETENNGDIGLRKFKVKT